MKARRFAPACVLAMTVLAPLPGMAQDDVPPQGPVQELFLPKSQKGPIVVVISGQSGTPNYRKYSAQVAGLGYYTVLVDGKDILTRQQDGAQNLKTVIARAQASPNAVPGKVAVVGFSQGGGGALAHATGLPELVSTVVAYYPATSWSKNIGGLAARIQVPVLLLAAERDRYNNCCLIESMRELETAAKARQAPFELVVYPNADHGFNLDGRTYRGDDTADAWRRTTEMLARHHSPK